MIKSFLSYLCGEDTIEKKVTKLPTECRHIKTVGIFNRYEVVNNLYYGLCGSTKEEVKILVGEAEFDSYADIRDGLGVKLPSYSKMYGFVAPSNYKLIESNIIDAED